MSKQQRLTFSPLEIQRLFGDEAADSEDIERLREYYFKSSVYDQFVTDLPLRILVGHKGIGKSALFRVAMSEDEEADRLAVLIKPSDVSGIGGNATNFLEAIRAWKDGLISILASKVLGSLGAGTDDVSSRLTRFGGAVLDFLQDTLKDPKKLDLQPAKKLVVDKFLQTGSINIYIDDLDRGWQGRKEDVHGISALLNAVRDIVAENRGIRFRISLRSDVYYLVRTSDESTDKIEGSVLWQSWTNHEIFVLLIKRIETFFGRPVNEQRLLATHQRDLAQYLLPVMEDRFNGVGKWENAPMYRVLMSLIRKRPRDLVKLCTLAARDAQKSERPTILTDNFQNIFPEYSQGRIQDTINEFKSELPDIARLVLNMKPTRKERETSNSYTYSTDTLIKKIRDIMESGSFRFKNGATATPKQLLAFMYKINFLTARKDTPTDIVRYYFEENRYLSTDLADFGYDWEIHPAYRWALQPDDPRDIYKKVSLSD